MYRFLFTTFSLATLALARTDLTGCTSTDVSSPAGASIAWYVPGTGELCDFLDCGGGRAPPKTTVPGCPQYSGTLSYSPSYLPGYGDMETGSATSAAPTTSTSDTAYYSTGTETGEPTFYAQTTGTEITTISSMSAAASSSSAVETTLITSPATFTPAQTPVIGGGTSNGTTTAVVRSGSGASNGTVTSGKPSSTSGTASQQTGAAMETARVWAGGVAMIGLGAVVAAL